MTVDTQLALELAMTVKYETGVYRSEFAGVEKQTEWG